MSTDPDQIRADIERTRADLSANVDRLTDEVNPKHVAKRQVEKVTGRVARVKDAVMGSAASAGDSVGSSVSSVGSTVGSAAADAPDVVMARTRGNPLAAGLIAFGVGALVASLLPATDVEAKVAETAKDKAQPFKDGLVDAAKDSAQHLKEPAHQAVQSVKESAAEAAHNVKDEGSSAAHDVRDDTQGAVQEIRESSR